MPEVAVFDSAADFRAWLEQNHATARELWVGYYKKGAGKRSVTYAEAVDEALCFGWIDGLTRSISDEVYANRFTPRRSGSNWSAANVRRVGELMADGRMHPAGIRAFEARSEPAPGTYTYDTRPADLPEALANVFREHPAAWQFYAAQPPSYRKMATWWIVSAKRPQTQRRRLERLIELSAAGQRLDPLKPK